MHSRNPNTVVYSTSVQYSTSGFYLELAIQQLFTHPTLCKVQQMSICATRVIVSCIHSLATVPYYLATVELYTPRNFNFNAAA